jgi:cytoskeleton protein RodZ
MTETEAAPGLVQIGETLRAAREGRGISLEQAATQLRCDQRVIEALEGGRFDDLGPPVFARGHLLRYAALLGEPGEAMVEEWSQTAAAGTSAELMRGLHGPRGRDLRQVRKRLVAAAALLSVAAIAIWASQNLTGRTAAPVDAVATVAATASTSPVSAPPPTPTATPTPTPTATPTLQASPTPPLPERPPDARPPQATAPAAGEASAPQPAAAQPRGQVRLRMAFAADSWLEIYDVRNRRLFFGLATVGAPVDVQGRAPLRVIVGNAPAATVELNGQRVEVPPGAMRGRRAAALRVNADGRLIALPRA